MSQPFSFPPPPPPPPSRQQDSPTDIRGGFRGRGSSRGHFARGGGQQSRGRGFHGRHSSQRGRDDYSQRASAPKRDFSTAFSSQAQTRPKAPPAVPSFDLDIKTLLPNKPSNSVAEPAKRRNNLLGLTPAAQTPSDSEDDADEEGKLATASTGSALQFEHRGQTLTLRTPNEIAAWVAERKRRFPTRAKAEAAKREAEEKKKQWEERKRAREESQRQEREARERARSERERQRLKEKLLAAHIAKSKSAIAESKEDATLRARQRAEKLKKKAERAARELEIAEQQLRCVEQADQTSTVDHSPIDEADNKTTTLTDISDDQDSDDTSSSGSDIDTESDLDDGPEQTTSKQTELEKVVPSREKRQTDSAGGPPLCRNMVKYGRCKYRQNCRFSHKVQKEKEKRAKPSIGATRRKGLYQIMVEKEQEEELKRALRVIIDLGERGILDPPKSTEK